MFLKFYDNSIKQTLIDLDSISKIEVADLCLNGMNYYITFYLKESDKTYEFEIGEDEEKAKNIFEKLSKYFNAKTFDEFLNEVII